MSKQLKLSHPLVEKILDLLRANDDECRNDMVSCQYLAAVIGYLVGQQRTDDATKKEMADELAAFIHHVNNDVSAQLRAPTPASPPADPAAAFGIWRPDHQ